jgi:hypothetical protein
MVDVMQESLAIDDNLEWIGHLSRALPKNGDASILDPLSFWMESQLNLLQASKNAIENEWKRMEKQQTTPSVYVYQIMICLCSLH